MPVISPEPNDALSNEDYPWWTLIGPGLATIVSLFMLTALYDTDLMAPIQIDLGLSDQEFLINGVVAYLIAAAIAFPLGFLLSARFLTAVIAVGVMVVGVLLVALVGGTSMLLAGRVLSGLGAGAAVGVTTAVVRRIRSRRSIVAAAVAALGVLAAMVAPFVNQVISRALSFRYTFLAAEPLLLVALIVSAITGIVLFANARRPAQPSPYGMPYPPPGPRP